MRITNKMMQNNSLTNINTNKLIQDKLNSQMTGNSKIVRPSDNPIVAIRALRLRTNVNQVTQYYEKNVPDAEAWLSLTESAVSSLSDVLTDMIREFTTGSNGEKTTEDKKTVLANITALRDQIYSTGNTDNAGRYIFTGYRTDTPLMFKSDTTKSYSITEQLKGDSIDSITYINTAGLTNINEQNFDAYNTVDENSITTTEVYRIQLAYDALDQDQTPKLELYNKNTQSYDEITATVASKYDDPNPYETLGDDDVVVIKETGEMLLGKNVYEALKKLSDDPKTKMDEAEFRITYEKSKWEKDDLIPEHYFACTDQDSNISYNKDYLDGNTKKQEISYDVGANQTVQVNTTANDIFTHDIGREIDDLILALEAEIAMEESVTKLEKMMENGNYSDTQKETIQKQLDAANKALTYLKENTNSLFQSGITKVQGHLNTVTQEVTAIGTRGSRLELISNRLLAQQTSYETLRSENEEIDIEEIAIKLTSAELTYNAALSATGKILQTTLMNFI